MSALLAWNVLLAVNLAIVWSLGNDITVGDDCLWSDIEDGGRSSKDGGLGRQRLLQMLLRAEGDRLKRRRRQQQQQQQQLLPYSPDGHFDWSTNDDSSSQFEATPTGQLQRHLSLELSSLLRRLCGPSSAKPTTTITGDEGGISAADDMYRHLSKFPRYGGFEGGERSREAEETEEEEELRKPEKRKRPTKTSELDPTFMLMGIGRK